jgi:putative proteasome-type protease
MTYCVGILVEAGLAIVADTRTNAGIDNVSTFRKLHVLAEDDDSLIIAASAGSLSVTQAALATLEDGLEPADGGIIPRKIADQPNVLRAAQLAGEALADARRAIGATLQGTSINANASLLIGGRVGDEPLSLYLIYAEGNFIECQPDSPFLQIGELKYGKPILDRALTYQTPLDEVVKVAFLSFDATMRSNLSVGRPLDLIVIPTDRDGSVIRQRIEPDDAYFNDLSATWGRLLNDARSAIPDPPFMRA